MNQQRLADIARSLEIARRDLDAIIAPELAHSATRSALTMISKLLQMLAQEMIADPADCAPRDAALAVVNALDAGPESSDRMLADQLADAMSGADAAHDPDLTKLLEVAAKSGKIVGEPAVWSAFDRLASAREARDSGTSDTAWDTSYQESAAGTSNRQPQPASQRTLTAAELTTYIRTHVERCARAEVTRLDRLPGGYSKGTYLTSVRLQDARHEEWVLRSDLPFTPLETRIRDEFPLLSALYQRGLPVAEPLWFENDPTRLGAALIAVRRVPGNGDLIEWTKDPRLAASIARQAATILAKIHRLDFATLPPLQSDAPGCKGASPSQFTEHVYEFWQKYRIDPDPMVELIFHWLRKHSPPAIAPRLVHGDYGLHNLLVHEGRINAVLDWEFAHIGDPRADLAYARPFIEKVLPWEEFLQLYAAAGGCEIDETALRFYSVQGFLRNSLGCMKVQHAVRTGAANIDAKFVYVGRSYAQQILRNAARLTGML